MRAKEFTGDADNNTWTFPDKQVQEGASMVAYHKHPKDDKLWTCLLYTSDAADE